MIHSVPKVPTHHLTSPWQADDRRAPVERLAYWVKERDRIRLERASGSLLPPFTHDPILAKYRFCNVNRNDDRETRWIHKHIIAAHANHPALWFNLAIARFINWSPTLERLKFMSKWDRLRFVEVIQGLMARGEKVYTGAYMIRAGTGEDAKKPKHEYLADRVFGPLWELGKSIDVRKFAFCSEWGVFLSKVFGMGDFMRNQIITDLKYTRFLPEDETFDWTTFCLIGPGTKRGINRVYDRPLTAPVTHDELVSIRRALRKAQTGVDPSVLNDLNNVANCLCEFDKYERVRLDQGKPRSRFLASEDALP